MPALAMQLSDAADVPVNLTGCSIIAEFRLGAPAAPITQTLQTPASGITITNATTGSFQLDQQLINWPAGTYYYTLKIVFATGIVTPILNGIYPVHGR